jgi:hypothetical protein
MAEDEIKGTIGITRNDSPDGELAHTVRVTGEAADLLRQAATDRGVNLRRTQRTAAPDLLLWKVIKRNAQDLSFANYATFTDFVLCGKPFEELNGARERASRTEGETTERFEYLKDSKRFLPFNDTDAYRLLKVATEAFVMVNCAVPVGAFAGGPGRISDVLDKVGAGGISAEDWETWWSQYTIQMNGDRTRLTPYLALIRRKFHELPLRLDGTIFREREIPQECYGILQEKLVQPCLLELIWSYWQEQGMLVQTMNAVSRRFQNVRGAMERDPLAMVEIDPLRPLNNFLWGYVQDEQHRLSLLRRVYEYDHHYGLTLEGKAVPETRFADSRSRFLEAFHNLLHMTSLFFRQDDDTTVVADGFPVRNALRDVHMLLSEGAHNQFGDLPATARIEMLMQQWLLARPEFREVLPTRMMVAYPEPWMDRVDAMKKMQGWTDTSILHFHNLAVDGEQLLLSIRYGAWNDNGIEPDQAALWARFWRSQIQEYIHAYRSVTGVDLTADVTSSQDSERRDMQPSVLLRQRLETTGTRPLLSTAASSDGVPRSFRERRNERLPLKR